MILALDGTAIATAVIVALDVTAIVVESTSTIGLLLVTFGGIWFASKLRMPPDATGRRPTFGETFADMKEEVGELHDDVQELRTEMSDQTSQSRDGFAQNADDHTKLIGGQKKVVEINAEQDERLARLEEKKGRTT